MLSFSEARAFSYLMVLTCGFFSPSGHLLPQGLLSPFVKTGEVFPVLFQEWRSLASLTGLLRELRGGSRCTLAATMALGGLVVWLRTGPGVSFCLGLNK